MRKERKVVVLTRKQMTSKREFANKDDNYRSSLIHNRKKAEPFPFSTDSGTTAITTELPTTKTSVTTDSETTALASELTSTHTSLSTDSDTTELTPGLSSTFSSLDTDVSTDVTPVLPTTSETEQPKGWPVNEQFRCFCSCVSPLIPSGQAELEVFKQESKEQIEKELYVDATTLSSTVRRKTSAEDERPSAQSVGYLGVTLMALCFFFILALDITKVAACGQSLNRCLRKVKLT
ncbi:sushi, von Willebrand factor type A, EGF and pentraxin domain-containing protein 1 [Elysia marginata]|uniref:Sushi, von Willebrand factor type A, EGF and pentraxin domain-containing protein 1 n=1 Tax=Elysia marginata TaxID=1093978 RepID=A0AAV4IW98_9GAST|nr:sushi, von Willebrand factor type A, EGF and pentraxin domain-containing protein 1 [Elysia marginata]